MRQVRSEDENLKQQPVREDLAKAGRKECQEQPTRLPAESGARESSTKPKDIEAVDQSFFGTPKTLP
jgi:hypothetical protein